MNYFWVMLFGVIVGFGLGVFLDIVEHALAWIVCTVFGHISPRLDASGVYCTFCHREVPFK